jgi:hypothetical protein
VVRLIILIARGIKMAKYKVGDTKKFEVGETVRIRSVEEIKSLENFDFLSLIHSDMGFDADQYQYTEKLAKVTEVERLSDYVALADLFVDEDCSEYDDWIYILDIDKGEYSWGAWALEPVELPNVPVLS